MKTVIKRDGTKKEFNPEKIKRAIKLANAQTEKENRLLEESIDEIVESVIFDLKDEDLIKIETIQDLVEKELMTVNHDVAKCYILYREERTKERFKKLEIMKQIKEKLEASNVLNQNANVDEHSFGGRIGEADSELMKQMALDYYITKKYADNHKNNRIYIHDLDKYVVGMHNCLSIPFDDLLKNGFNTRQTDIRPASSVNTAFQLVAVIFQLQSLQQFGGVSATHLDWTMIPYVRKSFYKHYFEVIDIIPFIKGTATFKNKVEDVSISDECYKGKWYNFIKRYIWKKALALTIKETNQAVEGMYHNLNTLQSRSGNQLPFTSINYGTCTLPEGRIIIKALLDGSLKGVGKLHKTAIFPCGIFQKMKGVNDKGSPNYDMYQLAIKSTTRRLYPNYANVDWSGNAGYDINDPKTYFSTMGCRTANGYDINGFGQLKDGRGNIAPTTIILPTLAMEAKKKAQKNNPEYIVDYFMEILREAISDAKDALIERYNWICAQNPASAKFMYENNTMAGYIPEEGIRSALKHGTLAIGQIGLAECLQILVGCDHTKEKGMNLAKEIEKMFKEKCAEYKENYKLNFGVYYTPAENLCYTSMQKFKKKYGVIENVSENDFFTNSMHVPVWKEMSPFEKIDIESQLTGYSSAGCITYVELDDSAKNNEKAVEQIVDYAMSKDIPYFAINVPNDTCNDCGYTDEINDCCPKCGGTNISRLRRVTGYLTGDYLTAFNLGKQSEAKMRKKHSNSMTDWNK